MSLMRTKTLILLIVLWSGSAWADPLPALRSIPRVAVELVSASASQPQPLVNSLQQLPESDLNPVQTVAPMETRIDINIPARKLVLTHQGEQVFEFPVAVGAPSFKTPVGPRELTEVVWNPWWLPPPSPWAKDEKPAPPGPRNPLGPVKMNLGAAILLHGTNNESSVGRAASHGCMRLYNEDAKTLAWWVQQHYSQKTDPTLRDTYEANRSKSHHVKLSVPIPVNITYDVIQVSDGKMTIHPDVYWRVPKKKEKILELLSQKAGLAPESLNLTVLEQLMATAKKESAEVAIDELRLLPDDPYLPVDGSAAEESAAAAQSDIKYGPAATSAL